MAWNRTKRVVDYYPLISETSVATKEKIYKDQRKLQEIVKKLDYQRLNVERQFDMDKRSIREELRTRVGTRTIQLDAVDLPKLRQLGLEHAPRQVILTLLRAFPDLFHDTDTRLPRLSREETGCDVFDGSSAEENLMQRLMALVLPNREKLLTPAQSVDRLIHEKNITFMRTTNECKEQYRKEHMTFDPSLSFRQREYLRRQRSARSARRRGRQLSVDTVQKVEETDKKSNNEVAIDTQIADELKTHQVEIDSGENVGADNSHGVTETEKGKKIVEYPSGKQGEVTLPDEILFEAEDTGSRENGETFTDDVHAKQACDRKPAASPRRLRFTPDGRKREDVLRAVGELLQRSHTFSHSAGTAIHNKLQDESRHSKSQPMTPTNARMEKGVSLRIRQKYLHEPRRQIFIRNVTQEKVRRLERRSRGQQRGYVPSKMTAPTLVGWHTIMQNSAHNIFRRGSGREGYVF